MARADTAHRHNNPVDLVEQFASSQDWPAERTNEDELTMTVAGTWADYHVSLNWREDLESLHIACAFDFRVPDARLTEVYRLLAQINEQMWLGHFDLWREQDLVMFRHSLCLAGGAAASDAQCGAVVKAAVNACETYYQAFQFVLWADRGPREALAFAAFETRGSA